MTWRYYLPTRCIRRMMKRRAALSFFCDGNMKKEANTSTPRWICTVLLIRKTNTATQLIINKSKTQNDEQVNKVNDHISCDQKPK